MKIIILSGSRCKNTVVESLLDYSLGTGGFEKRDPWYRQNTDLCLRGDGRKKKDKYFRLLRWAFLTERANSRLVVYLQWLKSKLYWPLRKCSKSVGDFDITKMEQQPQTFTAYRQIYREKPATYLGLCYRSSSTNVKPAVGRGRSWQRFSL